MGEQERTPEVMSLTTGEELMLKANNTLGAIAGVETVALLLKGKPIAAAVGAGAVLVAGKMSGLIRGA